jgi:hypothetical protein
MLPLGGGASPLVEATPAGVTKGIAGLDPRGLPGPPPIDTFGGNLIAGIGAPPTRGTKPEPFVAGGTKRGVGCADAAGGPNSLMSSSNDSSGRGMEPEWFGESVKS